jgi:hypothetical protein
LRHRRAGECSPILTKAKVEGKSTNEKSYMRAIPSNAIEQGA